MVREVIGPKGRTYCCSVKSTQDQLPYQYLRIDVAPNLSQRSFSLQWAALWKIIAGQRVENE